MTLKEKFRPHAKFWDCYNDEPLKYDHENKCVKIADEFAIGFAEWSVARAMGFDSFKLNNGELEIYKKEKEV
jgi:hypothetical protein